jgi:hypothetical protein
VIGRAAAALVAAVCAALDLWLAAHHPISAWLACGVCAALALVVLARPGLWLAVVLTSLPLAGLMPWTGWIAVEEMDLVVLAIAAAGYAQVAAHASGRPSPERSATTALLWLLPLACSTAWAMGNGFADAGGFEWGWWQGYREPMNSLRLAKSIFEVILLLPLWRLLGSPHALGPARALSAGILGLLLFVALAVLWERIAFTGVFNFSTDYRATGPFWEMHVGGAALDAALAASLPFAVAALAGARTPLRAVALSLLLALGLYAALVTFSRIVLAAVPLGLASWWWLRSRCNDRATERTTGLRSAALVLTFFAALAAGSFPSSGYRGLLALLALFALSLRWPEALRGVPMPARWHAVLAGLAAGLGGALLVGGATLLMPRGAYFAFALAWFASAMLLSGARVLRLAPTVRAALSLAGLLTTLSALVAIELRWGGDSAVLPTTATAGVLIAVMTLACVRSEPPWPVAWRWQVQTVTAAALIAISLGVLVGGDYFRHRLSRVVNDGDGRQEHWRQSLQMLGGIDWLLGKGLGRYAANRALSGRIEDQTGDYRLIDAGAHGQAVVISSGKRPAGWGEIFRLSQRIETPAPGPLRLLLELRTDQDVRLQAEVCEKHLIYAGTCIAASRVVQARPGAWQAIEVELPTNGRVLSGGPWYAPRLTAFSVALTEIGQRAEFDNLRLVDSAGVPLLRNGDFEQGLARWFFSSDRRHLPWHAKNLALHLLIEQGVLGLAAFGLAIGAALWRTSAGAARRHPLGPVLFASLLSVMVVGAVDSLFDMPRITFLTLLLIASSLMLPATPAAAQARH